MLESDSVYIRWQPGLIGRVWKTPPSINAESEVDSKRAQY